ncbi:MAG: aminomethyl-transferring glycine dehydrogenase subunit GcvPA [Thermoplasmata archaeon]|nr:aminomethyl-transferring glycine dehydrogenase subunit GcvPA [Thermoplasmata archaeon]
MQYIPNATLKTQMLQELGYDNIAELFSDIPPEIRIENLNLPEGKSELEVKRELTELANKNHNGSELPSFLGAGIYNHYVPSIVNAILDRSEFYSCYTPYQPELSQGILQALFEYQSLIAELTGMDAANTSMYDAPTALGEAVLMAARITRKTEIIIPKCLHWEKRSVLENYIRWVGLKVREIPYSLETGKAELNTIEEALNENTAGVYIENPNFFGVFEDIVTELSALTAKNKSMLITGINPLSLGIVKSPGDYGADIVIGDAQGFGNPMHFGGPSVGIFACKKEYIRKMPGRIIGLTHDTEGRRAFCMTLQTREQHIRRGKATSNICTNHALCAVATAIHLAALGKCGIAELAELNLQRARYLAGELATIEGLNAPLFNDCSYFNEFIVHSTKLGIEELNAKLLELGVIGGLELTRYFPELGETMLVATTETHTQQDYDKFIDAITNAIGGDGGGA